MLARAHTFILDGLRPRHVTIEVDVRPGLPAFSIVGLADTAVREARERVRSAIVNSGFEFPARRITANLAPADVRKAGPGVDLGLACAVLAASGQLTDARLDTHTLLGELALDGAVRPCPSTLAIAHASRQRRLPALLVAAERADEARLVEGLEVQPVRSLRSAARVLAGGRADPSPTVRDDLRGDLPPAALAADLSDVRGQHHAVRALVIAAAGGHNLLLSGPPGAGKTMLARRITSILPPLGPEESLEVASVASLAEGRVERLVRERPFRAPHHTITAAGLVGGAAQVGEVVLAHNGVLFLDELAEFSRVALEALRQPIEEGRVAIVRARERHCRPARFMLLAATNPCPCGFAGERERCRCSESEMARHQRKLSGPLLDRIDILATLSLPAGRRADGPLTSSREARGRVIAARQRQAARLDAYGLRVNAEIGPQLILEATRPTAAARELIARIRHSGLLTARGEDRVLRVARTLADLAGGDRVRDRDVLAAVSLRPALGAGTGATSR